MKTNPNEPLNCNNGNGFWNDEKNHTHSGIGLTKREYFAAMALSGLTVAAIVGVQNADTTQSNYDRARQAVNLADALINTLNENK